MNSKNENSSRIGLEIAIIGIACRFPGAKNVNEYWENLRNGVESISFFSDEELTKAGISADLIKNPNYVKASGVLEDVEYFDASFFGYTPKEAEIMNPQMRHFHECAWEALEDAGYNPDSYNGLIGLYAGSASSFFWEGKILLSGKDRDIGSFAAGFLTNTNYLPAKISYKFNLKGPISCVQTACSTSLVAIHWACRSVLSGECHIALAGGVRINVNQKKGYIYEEGMILSPDGHCRAFSSEAKGTLNGNGIGIVVLKRLKNAIADRDHIYAVVKGSAINNDGNRKVSFTSPSVPGQVDVIQTAQAIAHVEPESIGYIETHGTGTPLGDPIEIEALTLAFNTNKRNFCAIGAVKTNIGHLDTAAGVAGFIKTALSLKYKLIPPSLNYEKPNPMIDFKNSPFFVNTQLTEWKSNGYPRRAGVSSFGIGGTNAHIILEESPKSEDTPGERDYQLLLLSAKTQPAIDRITDNLNMHLKTNSGINIADVAYTLSIGRKHFNYRKVALCSSIEEAINAFSSPELGAMKASISKDENTSVIFMFPGQGSQYVRMGFDLYSTEPIFRQEMDRCFAILDHHFEYDIKNIIFQSDKMQIPDSSNNTPSSSEHSQRINQTEIAQIVIFIFEYALAKLLMALGIEPYAMIGHSIGEYAAACLSGVFSLEDVLKTVVSRGKLMQKMSSGLMLSIPLSEEEIIPLLEPEISLAAVNSTSRCVVSGNSKAIDSFQNKLKAMGYESSLLHTSHAFHSMMMDPMLNEFKEQINSIKLNDPKIPYISNLTGKWISSTDISDPGYWSKHIRNTVRFSEGIDTLLENERSVFIEIGPGNTLSTFVRQHKNKKASHFAIDMVRHPKDQIMDNYFLLNKIGQLWLYGVKIDWFRFYSDQKRYRISLPPYSFEKQWYDTDVNIFSMGKNAIDRKTFGKNKNIEEWFYTPSWKQVALPGNEINIHEKSNWLLFMDGKGVGAELIKRLVKYNQDVVQVEPGPAFDRIGEKSFIINPKEVNDYFQLFSALKKDGNLPGKIIHLWSLIDINIEKKDAKSFEKCLDLNFYSFIYLVQAMEKDIANNINIEVVTTNIHDVNGEERLCPEKATVLGPCKSIPQEYPNIRCRCFDIGLLKDKKHMDSILINRLFSEIISNLSDLVVTFRNNHRWVQVFEPLRLEDSLEKVGELKLKEGGVYLITGGLGKVGYTFAKFLAKEKHAKLILTGFSEFPPRYKWEHWLTNKNLDDLIGRKIRKAIELEELGGEVLVYSADVTNKNQMEAIIKDAEKKFGPMNGVIYAAGVVRGQSISPIGSLNKTKANIQFQTKLYGLLVLEEILAKMKLDFCLLTSSLSSILGGLGFLAYSTANIFMDTYTHYHNNKKTSSPWISVNWDGWKSSERSHHKTSGGTVADLSMESEEGIKAFLRILSCGDICQIVNSTGYLESRITQWIKLEPIHGEGDIDNDTSVQQRPNLTNSYISPQNVIEQDLCDIWKKLFGFEIIGIDDDFYEMGGDSLKAVTLTTQIKKIGYSISLTDIIMLPTIRKLAFFISEKGLSKESVEEVNQKNLLSKLDCIERLNQGRNEKNLFIVHPAHGMVNQYQEMAVLLEKNYNAYGIQARGVSLGASMHENPEQMIKDYLEQLLAVQNGGPYFIAGYCIGVGVAYEIVRRLENLGYMVEKLIIIDEPLIYSDRFIKILRLLEFLPDFLKKIFLIPTKRRFKRKIQSIYEVAMNGSGGEEIIDEHEFHKNRVLKHLNALCRNLLPLGIIKASILAIFAETSEYHRSTETDFYKITKGNVTLIKTPGEHNIIFDKPYVEELVEIIKKL